MPASVTLHVAPIELPTLRNELQFWATPLAGLDLSVAGKIAVNSGHSLSLSPSALLGPSGGGLIDLATIIDAPMTFTTNLIAAREGTLDGIGGWFVAEAGAGVTMSNARVIRIESTAETSSSPLTRLSTCAWATTSP